MQCGNWQNYRTFVYFRNPVFEFIDPVFAKTFPKPSFSITENERFGLVFAKTGSINSGTGGKTLGSELCVSTRLGICWERFEDGIKEHCVFFSMYFPNILKIKVAAKLADCSSFYQLIRRRQ
jgi:hypothetical protein